MTNSSDNLKDVCKDIKKIDDCLQIDIISTGVSSDDTLYSDYCPMKNGKKWQCETNDEKISAGFIWLLVMFEHLCDEKCSQNEKDQYVEYAILWLSYILNQISNEGISTLKDFYTNNIEKNTNYTTHVDNARDSNYKEIVDNKINSMNMNIKDIPKFYEALKTLCNMYTGCNEKKENYTSCSQDAQKFAKHFEGLNQDSSITGNSSYRKILYNLFNDYYNFKNGCAKKCSGCTNIPILPEIKAPASSSIASKLIPALLAFSIAFFLGIAYK
ncbi:Plasmodium variant antigen protein Cir/Yir/Bir, putative, partial [Plasmodium chabaudi chabaudi]